MNSVYISWIYLISLLLGYILVGWLLAAFNVPRFVWFVTLSIALHLSRVGTDAIVLAIAWVVSIMFVGATLKAWPIAWPHYIYVYVWATNFLFLWLLAIVLVFMLAFAGKAMRSLGLNKFQSFCGLVSIIWTALGLGWCIYALIIPGNLSY